MKLTEYKVSVSRLHIKQGRRSAHYCPVALAVAEVTGECVAVNRDYVRLYVGTKGIHYASPRTVHDFVVRYDSKKSVKPFTFTLREQYEAR